MSETVIKFDNVKKEYRLGQIGGGTLKGDLQSWAARIRGKEDPNSLIGSNPVEVGKRFLALDGISFEVKKGEALGIIGHNGAGKSTLLKLLSRVTAPSSGTISYNGRIASMLEVGTGFHPEMTGRENIYMNGAILGMTKAEIDAKMEDIIEFSEVRQFIDTPVKRYSSGMYVKLAFSVAAHLDSEIMIMDEVLAVGDMAFQKKCLDKMKQAASEDGRTVLYVSHNMSTIRQLCDRCIVLNKGKIVFDGNVEDAINSYMSTSEIMNGVDLDLSDKRMKHLPKDLKIKMQRLQLCNKEVPVYQYNEEIHLILTVRAFELIENLCLRIEIRSVDGSTAGSSFLHNFATVSHNSYSDINISLLCNGLVPGRYNGLIVVYQVNKFGDYVDLDAVFPAFSFEIVDTENNMGIIWDNRSWGHIKLNDLVLNAITTNIV